MYDAIYWGIKRMLRLTGAREYTVYLSGPNNFRYRIDPEYKANRKGMEKPYHYGNMTDYLINMHDAVVTDGAEADDYLAMALTSDPDHSICGSIDKDLKQVSGLHFDIVKEKTVFVDEIEAARNFYSQMLQGDRTDNITGIRGIGPVKADKIVNQFFSEDALSDHIYRMYVEQWGDDGERMFNMNWDLLRLVRTKEELERVIKLYPISSTV